MEHRYDAGQNLRIGLGGRGRSYRDRAQAGESLARELEPYRSTPDLLVLGLPRGGVPVAAIVARELGAELDVMIVRKLGVPGHEELAMGALASGGVQVMNPEVVRQFGITEAQLQAVVAKQLSELRRRELAFRGERPPVRIAGRTVILVDDGVATGATMRAAIAAIRTQAPRKLVIAVPVAPAGTLTVLEHEADQVVCPLSPPDFFAIGQYYADFSQVTTEAAREVLEAARSGPSTVTREPPARPRSGAARSEVHIPVPGAEVLATLTLPAGARAIVAFAHGSGSSRFSARNRFVARSLEQHGLGTLLADLLTLNEEAADHASGRRRFDIGLLTARVVAIIDWLDGDARTAGLPIGLFGASTGAAAALAAATRRPEQIRAVVSRGGRPDLASSSLPLVRAPTLLIVGGDDRAVLELNRAAATQLAAGHQLEVVPGATHLFEEPGKLETVAELAADFFHRHLTASAGDQDA